MKIGGRANMDKKNFREVVESLREGGVILRGTKKASRTWTVENGKRIETKECVRTKSIGMTSPEEGTPTEDGKFSKETIEAFRREYALKKIKLGTISTPLFNKRSIILGACALVLTLVSVFVVPLILRSGISRYKPDPVWMAKMSLDTFARALGRYRFHVGAYPTNEEGLEVLVCHQPEELAKIRRIHPGWKGPYVDCIMKDPWDRKYVYVEGKDGDPPVLYSCGPDRKAGTPDDLFPHQALFNEQSWDTSWTKWREPNKLPACQQKNECKTAKNEVKLDFDPGEFEDLDDVSDITIPLLVGVITLVLSWLLLRLICSRRR